MAEAFSGGRFSGVHWMLATPFGESEGFDAASMTNLVDKAVATGWFRVSDCPSGKTPNCHHHAQTTSASESAALRRFLAMSILYEAAGIELPAS